MKNMPQYPRPQTLIDCMIVIWKLFKIMKLEHYGNPGEGIDSLELINGYYL